MKFSTSGANLSMLASYVRAEQVYVQLIQRNFHWKKFFVWNTTPKSFKLKWVTSPWFDQLIILWRHEKSVSVTSGEKKSAIGKTDCDTTSQSLIFNANIIYNLEPQAMDVDPYDLLDPVDILSKMPKDFYENMVRIH